MCRAAKSGRKRTPRRFEQGEGRLVRIFRTYRPNYLPMAPISDSPLVSNQLAPRRSAGECLPRLPSQIPACRMYLRCWRSTCCPRFPGCVRTGTTNVHLDVSACLAPLLACYYAAINSPIRTFQRAQYSRRWSANDGTRSRIAARMRKYWRCSSKARQKRGAASKVPNPRMG